MSWLNDLLKDYPALSVAEQRLKLAQERMDSLEQEKLELRTELQTLQQRNEDLEAELAELRPGSPIDGPKQLVDVLVHLFNHPDENHRHLGAIAAALDVNEEMARYYLDELHGRELATLSHGNYITGHSYYALTPKGRAFVAENGLA